ncbi:MAG: SEC-C domain-containing protein [Desulfobulbaceae bacterium]|jgi:hypothetical protein|nr:SEC-C domain-containing protein [Desulfobulbaceae bacterium]
MDKIGRNDRCPCGSGRKYKHCCAGRDEAGRQAKLTANRSGQITLSGEIAKIQAGAREKSAMVREVGVFILFATAMGDAWLLEMSDCDAIQIATAGQPLDPQIEENSETIAINWSHAFAVKNKTLTLTAYADRAVLAITDAPSQTIAAALRRLSRRFSDEQLRQVHVSATDPV